MPILIYSLAILFMAQSHIGMCQSKIDTIHRDTLYMLPADSASSNKPNALPRFSYDNVKEYIFKTLSYPTEALDKGIEGTVYVGFDVETNGTVTNINLVEPIHALLDAEALRLIQNMPLWQPFRLYRDTKLSYTVPIIFKIKEEEDEIVE